jgi:hypothetical protein
MEDPVAVPTNNNNDEEAELQRRRLMEEEMERLMLAQEQDDDDQDDGDEDDDDADPGDDSDAGDDDEEDGDGWELNDDGNGNDGGDGIVFLPDQLPAAEAAAVGGGGGAFNYNPQPRHLSYIQTSFGAALALVYYAYRSRQQWYLAIIFLTSSKWAYIVMGNALIASLISLFRVFTSFFLDGLRLAEVEGIAGMCTPERKENNSFLCWDE